ncbi:MAG TPA: MMPL family transporter [Casimicrobiaceae bacterium]|nr:MMPL family transporter [Casimicrobiaceae bacterium]
MTSRKVAAVTVWAAALAVSLFWIARQLVVTTDLSAFLPAAATPAQALLVKELRDGVASRLVLAGIAGSDPETLSAASEALVGELANDPRFAAIANGNIARMQRERDAILRWRYLLSRDARPERFTAAGLRESFDEAQRLLASPLASIVRPLIASDPTGETLRIAQSIAGGPRHQEHGVWFSEDRRRALITFATRAAGFDLDAQQAAVQAIRDAFARVAPPSLILTLSSPGVLAVESRRAIENDAKLASSLTLAGVTALLLFTYRSVWPTLLSAIPALTGLAIGIVVVSMIFGPVHAITLGFGAMLIGEAVDYPTYLFANNAPGEPLDTTRSRIGATLALAVATTACGALAMILSGFRGLQQLGVLIISGVVVAGLCTRFVLPALTPANALVRKQTRGWFDFTRWLPLTGSRQRLIVGIALALAIAILVIRRESLWDDDLANLNPVSAGVKAQDRELRAQLGAPDLRYLVVTSANDEQQALVASENVMRFLDALVTEKVIGGYDAAARYLPSEVAQRARRAALPDAATLRASLAAALAELPFRSDAFNPFLVEVERARTGPLLRRDDLANTTLGLRVDALLSRDGGRWNAILPLSGVTDAAAVARALSEHRAAATLLDLKSEADTLVASYRERAVQSSLIGLAAIFAVLLTGVRSLPKALRLMVPVIVAVLLTAAALVAAGQKLGVFHVVALLLVVGVGINYALFFGRENASKNERDLTTLSVIVAGLATLCASLSLAIATTPVLRAIGVTTALGAVFAFVVSAMLVSGMRR